MACDRRRRHGLDLPDFYSPEHHVALCSRTADFRPDTQWLSVGFRLSIRRQPADSYGQLRAGGHVQLVDVLHDGPAESAGWSDAVAGSSSDCFAARRNLAAIYVRPAASDFGAVDEQRPAARQG